jgi:hypothetical protein
MIVEEQRLEIERLKAQRQEDLNDRLFELCNAHAKVKAQEEVTSEFRNETKAEIHDRKLHMTEMMNTFKAVFPQSKASPGENK